MPVFKVLRQIDAFVNCIADVEADTAAEAVSKASDDERAYEWEDVGTHCFDARSFVALDENDEEIESTKRGDF